MVLLIRSLADRTVTSCEDLEIYLDGWNREEKNEKKKEYLKEQVLSTLVD